jgi:hypothetical protein
MHENKLKFSIFIIYSLSEKLNKPIHYVYNVLNKTHILDEYIIGCYDMLHTLGKEYLIEDILEFMHERTNENLFIDYKKMSTSKDKLEYIYKQNLDENIILQITTIKNIDIRKAMDIYYKSELSKQISEGKYGIDNLDYHYLAEDLIENESYLFD